MELAQRLSPGRSPPKKSGLAEPVGTNTRWRLASTDSGAQALAALALAMLCGDHCAYTGFEASRGIGSQLHTKAPVRASKARTVPSSSSTARLSPMEEPTMTLPSTMAGGEVTR